MKEILLPVSKDGSITLPTELLHANKLHYPGAKVLISQQDGVMKLESYLPSNAQELTTAEINGFQTSAEFAAYIAQRDQ
jgi:hypothetical protein